MARLPLVDDHAGSSESFTRSNQGFGFVPNLYRTLANAPALLDAWIPFAWALREQCESPRSLRELCVLRVAILTDAEYEWDAHVPMALAAGVTIEAVTALRDWESSELFSGVEGAALAATDELIHSAALTDATWQRLRTHLEQQQCIEVVLTIAFYACVSRVIRGLDIPLEGERWTQALGGHQPRVAFR